MDGGGGDAHHREAAGPGVDAPAEAAPASITLSASCPDFAPCGGDVVGTWTATGGCLDDPLSTSKSLCPAIVVNSETATVKGSVTFTSSAVMRSYATHYAMDVTIPAACLGAETCSQIQAGLAIYIPDATCADAAGGCHCSGTLDTSATQSSMYTTSADEIVTSSGDRYAYCVTGSTLEYRHTSGPSPETGTYTLQK